jgi:hypothetical protein
VWWYILLYKLPDVGGIVSGREIWFFFSLWIFRRVLIAEWWA